MQRPDASGHFGGEDPGPLELVAADGRPPLGARLADKVAAFGGSWTFIFCFGAVLVSWVLLNSGVLARWHHAFDPYPYILLNLFLSMLAAIQAPVIMMSQNRQAAKDRLQAEHDYQVNLRAELEIGALHEKLDVLREIALRRSEDASSRSILAQPRSGRFGSPGRPASPSALRRRLRRVNLSASLYRRPARY